MVNRKYKGEPIDSTYQHFSERPSLEKDAENVEYATKNNDNDVVFEGEINMDYIDWPDGATRPEELNEDQRKIIRTAYNMENPKSMYDVQRQSSVDKDYNYAKTVLKRHWPVFAEQYKRSKREDESENDSVGRGSPIDISPEEVDEFRKKLVSGEETTISLGEQYGFDDATVYTRVIGRHGVDDSECELPPVTYDRENGSWEYVEAPENEDIKECEHTHDDDQEEYCQTTENRVEVQNQYENNQNGHFAIGVFFGLFISGIYILLKKLISD